MILYLVRHGRSEANERKLVTGTPDDGLSSFGRNQAEVLAEWLSEQKIEPERFMVSHWRRAKETAEIVFPSCEWVIDRRLGETDAGRVADWPLAKFRHEFPSFYENPANAYPAGEAHLDLNARVLAWLDEQLLKPCRAIAVVAHSGPISCVLQYVLAINMELFPAFLPMHATISVVHFTRDGGVWRGRLMGFSLGPSENVRGLLHGEH